MRKWLVAAVAALVLAMSFAAVAEVGADNPWTDTTEAGLMEALGLALGVPEGATDVAWRMLEEQQLGELRFTWQDVAYTARIAPTDDFENISGLYCHWQVQSGCTVGRCEGVCYRGSDEGDTVDLCLWYDELTGLMYSLSVSDKDLDGFDITAAAQQVFIPMQTE